MKSLIFLLCVAVATCLPLDNATEPLTYLAGRVGLSVADYDFLDTLPKRRIGETLPGFQYLFVDANGQTSYTRGASGTQIEIAGSPGTHPSALQGAANTVSKMTRYMPHEIFTKVASNAAVGVFSKAEKLIVYPEYAYLANGDCGTSCDGSCGVTCTFDGRKYENVAGVGGERAVILEDNVLCTDGDPYYKKENILSHEFTHTIHRNGLDSTMKHQITSAYNAAKSAALWTLSAYSMANDEEYLAEAATTFFGVNTGSTTHPGGMNLCNGQLCRSEAEFRENLRTKDPALFNILSTIFTNNNPSLLSGLTVCPPASILVG